VRFDQVKILARDLEPLLRFYQEALGCELVIPPLVTENVVSRGVGVPGATVTLSTLCGSPVAETVGRCSSCTQWRGQVPDDWDFRPGNGQLAFQVDDLEAAIGKVVAAGGSQLGEVVEWQGPSGATARFVYLRDPEGNIVDLYSRVD
jgi:glyoxylase I family protein